VPLARRRGKSPRVASRPALIRDPHHSLLALPALILTAVVLGSSGR
jgi:hypothetical protein